MGGGIMTRDDAKAFLHKAEEYLSSADDNLILERRTVAAGDAIHAGISAKDAIMTALTATTGKHKDHTTALPELRRALGHRDEAAGAERALRELLAAKTDVEYGTMSVSSAKAAAMVRRAHSLVDLAANIVRRGR